MCFSIGRLGPGLSFDYRNIKPTEILSVSTKISVGKNFSTNFDGRLNSVSVGTLYRQKCVRRCVFVGVASFSGNARITNENKAQNPQKTYKSPQTTGLKHIIQGNHTIGIIFPLPPTALLKGRGGRGNE